MADTPTTKAPALTPLPPPVNRCACFGCRAHVAAHERSLADASRLLEDAWREIDQLNAELARLRRTRRETERAA
jgi:hypothetical protein